MGSRNKIHCLPDGKNYHLTVDCSCSCNITIAEDDLFFVVWELSNMDETHNLNSDSEGEYEDNEVEIENENQECDPQEITHTLPFK